MEITRTWCRRRFLSFVARCGAELLPAPAARRSRCAGKAFRRRQAGVGCGRWMSCGGTRSRVLRATGGDRRPDVASESSRCGRASSMPLATMASGLAAMTASTLTSGAIVSSLPTRSPPHRRDHAGDDLAAADGAQRLFPHLIESARVGVRHSVCKPASRSRSRAAAASRPSVPASVPKTSVPLRRLRCGQVAVSTGSARAASRHAPARCWLSQAMIRSGLSAAMA